LPKLKWKPRNGFVSERRMTMSTIETILSRAMSEPEFAELLFTDFDRAMAEYDLSTEEYARLKAISRTEFEALALEDRKSMMKHVANVKYNDFTI